MRPLLARVLAAALQRRFRTAQASGLTAVLEMRVLGPGGRAGIPLAVDIAGGAATVSPGTPEAPGAVAVLGLSDLVALVRGTVGWPELLGSGRMQLSGDPFLALRLPKLFDLPAAARHSSRHVIPPRELGPQVGSPTGGG